MQPTKTVDLVGERMVEKFEREEAFDNRKVWIKSISGGWISSVRG